MANTEAGLPPKQTRRTHQKSRSGCKNCKLRRIKCDEIKPHCTNCLKFDLSCSLSGTVTPVHSESSGFDDDDTRKATASRPRGRPRKDWRAVSASVAAADSPRPRDQSFLTRAQRTPQASSHELPETLSSSSHQESLNIADLQLMHHWTTRTSSSIANRKEPHPFWSLECPRLGFAHSHTLHLMLAMAGLHMYSLRPGLGESHRSRALHHFTIGLSQTRTALLQLTKDNAHALYVSAILICFGTFAMGPNRGDYLMFGVRDEGDGSWFSLIRGVRGIIETMGTGLIHDKQGPLGALVRGETGSRLEQEQHMPPREGRPPVDWQDPVEQLRGRIVNDSAANTQIYLSALNAMIPCFEAVWGKTRDAEEIVMPDQEHKVFVWLYLLDDDFIGCLVREEPVALVVLGFYTSLLEELQCFWFMKGWPEHLLRGVYDHLPKDYHNWIQWPVQRLQEQKTRQWKSVV